MINKNRLQKGVKITPKLSSNMSRNNNTDGTNSPYKLLLNDIKAYR